MILAICNAAKTVFTSIHWFLPLDIMLTRYMPCVYLSVCPSQAAVLAKRLHTITQQHRMTAWGLDLGG